jgi:hypothetical protein
MSPVSTKVASIWFGQGVADGALPRARRPVDRHRPAHRRGAGQRRHLARPQPAPLALAQALEAERPDARAHEPLDPAADGVEQAAHLALAALADPDPQPGAPLVALALDLRRRRREAARQEPGTAVLELHAVAQPLELAARRGRRHEGRVLALVP